MDALDDRFVSVQGHASAAASALNLAQAQDLVSPPASTSASSAATPAVASVSAGSSKPRARKGKNRDPAATGDDGSKRRCVSTACIACRRRKSKCDGNLPACAACSSVYNTECVYDPNSDHRRKGVYKKDIDKLKTRNSTLEVLIHAILNVPEDEVPSLVRQIRTCESLDTVAEGILAGESLLQEEDDETEDLEDGAEQGTFEGQLSGKIGGLHLEDGSTRYLGGTSNLIYLAADPLVDPFATDLGMALNTEQYATREEAIVSWTDVTLDPELVMHLINMYFTWHYTYFTALSKTAFFRDFRLGAPPGGGNRKYCSPLLVNAMLALGCHFTGRLDARAVRDDSATAGDHFFREAKRLIMANDEHEHPRLSTVQALALMSVREAGCGREAKGWVYSGMSFRMACDLGLNLDSSTLSGSNSNSVSGLRDSALDDEEIDARRITFWGCFLFDKCWSNYLGRLPQLPPSIITVPKFDVFPDEESQIWAAYTDSGVNQSHAQPQRTRAVALQISVLCEISSDLMNNFYNPIDIDKGRGKQQELKKLQDIHQRLENWRRGLPAELEPKEGGLPSMLVMHMFFQLLYIHLFRPFLKYSAATSPLPPNVSPRRLCTQAASMISKLMRLYKRSHGLRQICNIAVYILHTACTIHLLNLPDKNAKRDITHGVKHLEEIAEGWLCARRTLAILRVLVRKWGVDLPEDAAAVLQRTEEKFGAFGVDAPRTPSQKTDEGSPISSLASPVHTVLPTPQTYFNALSGVGMDRRMSGTSLPPQSVAEMQARILTLSPAHTTAHATPTSRTSFDSTAPTPAVTTAAATAHSPSAMFGGVDQLLRDSQDWWMRDQSQLAVGFENWSMGLEEWGGMPPTPPVVTNGAGTGGGVNGAGSYGARGGVGMNGFSAGGGVGGGGGGVAGGGPVGGNAQGGALAFGGGIAQYPAENEWYA